MKKISLKDLKNGLKRDEMRRIQGGGCARGCQSDSSCREGCKTTDQYGCSECSGCCIA